MQLHCNFRLQRRRRRIVLTV